jgi:hypothetical protein
MLHCGQLLCLCCRVLQGPESWHPAPPALKDAARQAAELAYAAGVSLPRLAVKAAVQQAGSGVAVHLLGEWGCAPIEHEPSIFIITPERLVYAVHMPTQDDKQPMWNCTHLSERLLGVH